MNRPKFNETLSSELFKKALSLKTTENKINALRSIFMLSGSILDFDKYEININTVDEYNHNCIDNLNDTDLDKAIKIIETDFNKLNKEISLSKPNKELLQLYIYNFLSNLTAVISKYS